MKRMIVMLVAGAMLAAEATVVSVSNVVSRQRYPWNGLVDIDYELVCEDTTMDFSLSVIGHDRDRGRRFPLRTITGDGVGGTKAFAGKHRLTWDMTKDAPSLVTTNFVVDIQAYHGLPLYMVINTSCGYDSNLGFPITYLDAVPDGGWSDEYKATKIVLRRIDPGSFIMGSPETELGHQADEVQHPVTITKPYYIGVFEVTIWQWQQLMATGVPKGSDDVYYNYDENERPDGRGKLSKYGTWPRSVSYDDIRGSSAGRNWPISSEVDTNTFLWRLRKAIARECIDLPTEAQWEYACRAGTTTSINDGHDIIALQLCTYLIQLANCYGSWNTNLGNNVGKRSPNAWGLYDMHGGVAEWCLDRYGQYGESNAVQIDPRGSIESSDSVRVIRGGDKDSYAEDCRSGSRDKTTSSRREYHNYYNKVKQNWYYGFRLVVNVE